MAAGNGLALLDPWLLEQNHRLAGHDNVAGIDCAAYELDFAGGQVAVIDMIHVRNRTNDRQMVAGIYVVEKSYF